MSWDSLKSENKNKVYFIQVGIFLLKYCKHGLPRVLSSPNPPQKQKNSHWKSFLYFFQILGQIAWNFLYLLYSEMDADKAKSKRKLLCFQRKKISCSTKRMVTKDKIKILTPWVDCWFSIPRKLSKPRQEINSALFPKKRFSTERKEFLMITTRGFYSFCNIFAILNQLLFFTLW